VIVPPYLKQGDTVALIAPARFMDMSLLSEFQQWVSEHGWNLWCAPNLGKASNQLGGSSSERLEDILWALNTEEVKAVFTARGGYGTMQLLAEMKKIDFTAKPKWWVGFSDITALHIHLQNQGLCSIHGPMAMQFHNPNLCSTNSKNALAQLLKGHERIFDAYPVHNAEHLKSQIDFQESTEVAVSEMNFEGKLWGGNLSLVYAMLAAGYSYPENNFVLLIEDLDEYYYHIDRMLQSLDLAGIFKKTQAVVVGSICKLRDNDIPFGTTPLETLTKICDFYRKPLIWGLPVGHETENISLKLGFDITFDGFKLSQK
jgi:muramoyltetrapeptide carboxypeptidase